MICYKSEDIAHENQSAFNAALRELKARNGGGLEFYQVRSSSIVEYNPVDNSFYRHIEMHGYRPHSLGGIDPLSDAEIDDLYAEVAAGLADLYIVNCHTLDARRYWHGTFNLKPRRPPVDEDIGLDEMAADLAFEETKDRRKEGNA